MHASAGPAAVPAVADLIARDLADAPLGGHAARHDQIHPSFHDNTLALYLDPYALLGHAVVLPVAVRRDCRCCRGLLYPLFLHGRLTDLRMRSALRDELAPAQARVPDPQAATGVHVQPSSQVGSALAPMRAWRDRRRFAASRRTPRRARRRERDER